MRTKLKIGDTISVVEENGFAWADSISRYIKTRTLPVSELSDAEFLSLFDIPAVNELSNSGFNLRSTAALVGYFQSRVETDWLKAPSNLADLDIDTKRTANADLIARADLALDYDLDWSGVPPSLQTCGDIDWHTSLLHNNDWLQRINRHSWWVLLGYAYKSTGDEKYARAFARQMSSWVSSVGNLASGDEQSHVWSCKQVALRLRVSWIPAFGMFYNSPYFNTSRKLEMLRAIFDQARYLRQQKTEDDLVINGGLVSAGLCFPELRESKSWRTTAVSRCWAILPRKKQDVSDDNGLKQSSNLLAFSDRELAAVY